ncbi:pyridoxal-dependent decarboxylase conserved domain-containing protein [Pseudomassariella vexata]|uniref:Pyridoxal-dependent decarboxylase conserved domain-domain-containing protein n=1 Tax=Pseudomassariella vexata TaxID=1141098 RepID=A0A1Y2DVQ1_9PEZI|nr:pyridoxal-dependent decarboxylase conserved domain-containing protein [Pseudomassariella vexata]ORY63216.1 pyridoxal-dependent decarboxylase conserved domain-domain-containing protein [Pseudomassariella vexata]
MDSNQFREAAVASIDESERHVVSKVEPGYLRKLLPDAAPEDGEAWADIQKDIEVKIVPGLTHWQSPNFLAWFPCSSSFPGMLGEMWSAAFNGAGFNWICSPAVTELETIVLDWLARAFALPECYLSNGSTHGGGVIHGTASEAIATVMVAARDKYLREATSHLAPGSEELEDAIALKRSKLVALGSTATHSATQKAAMIAGVRFRAVPVRAEDGYKLTGEGLRKAITEIRAKGLEPFYLTVTLGTTDTCSIDDFDSITAVLAELAPPGPGELWVHVDAAYAGVALICPEYQHLSQNLDKFHSFNTNMHKWMLTNFDCSVLWVRCRRWLIEALGVSLAILRNDYTDSGLVTDYRDWQIPFGRRFRSLKIWFVVRTYGIKGLQAHIRKHIGFGEMFAGLVKTRQDLFEIVTGPRFALTVFKLQGKEIEGATLEDQNAVTKTLHDVVNAEGKIFLSSTVVGGVFAIRHCPSTPFVEAEHVKHHFQVLVEAAEKVLSRTNNTKI